MILRIFTSLASPPTCIALEKLRCSIKERVPIEKILQGIAIYSQPGQSTHPSCSGHVEMVE